MSLRRLITCVFIVSIAIALLPSSAFASATGSGSALGLGTSPQVRTFASAPLCPTCGGVGQLICPACGGAGTYFIIGYGGYMELWPCNVCLMTGRIICYTCLGTGLAPAVPYLVMTPTSMTFSATVGGGNPFSQALTVRRSDYGAWWARISAPAAWAQVSFSSGTFYVSPQTAGLAPGTYTTNVLVEMWSDGVDGTPVQGSPLHVPVTFVVNPIGTVATPTFTPNGGTFTVGQSVTIACATAGATIRYTTDGSDPTVSSALYSAPVNVSASKTLKARAFKTNWTGSPVAQSVFTIIPQTVATPTFTPNGGTFTSAQSVAIACATAGSTIRYTTDGSDPTVSSALYSAPVNVSASKTLRARAFKTGLTGSPAAQAVFTINLPHTIVPAAGAHGSVSPATTQTVSWGASRTFTITPAAGYHVASVLVDGGSVGAVASYTFTNVRANHTLSATFAPNYIAVYTPVAPLTMSYTKYYTLYGYLKPRHAAGTYPVRIYKWRYVSGVWKSYGYLAAKASDYSTYTKYSRSMKLPYKGTWRIRGYAPQDSQHVAKWSSGYDYITVKQ